MARAAQAAGIGRWRRRWLQWLQRRIPPAPHLVLGHRQLFIFPARQAIVVGLLWLALILTAINYQNAMVHALAFLVVSCFVVAIGHTYRNLAGLELRLRSPSPVFAGQAACWPVLLSAGTRRPRHALTLGFPGQSQVTVDIPRGAERAVQLPFTTTWRGWLLPPRLRVESRWPLGWLQAWSRIAVPEPALVYPAPRFMPLPGPERSGDDAGQRQAGPGDEDLDAWRAYQAGDSLGQVAWKAYARRGDLLVKTFTGEHAPELWLDEQSMAGGDPEGRLQILCGWVLQAESAGRRYGLRLVDATLNPDCGPAHERACLRALALAERGGGS